MGIKGLLNCVADLFESNPDAASETAASAGISQADYIRLVQESQLSSGERVTSEEEIVLSYRRYNAPF